MRNMKKMWILLELLLIGAIRIARYIQRNTERCDDPLIGGAERSMIGDPPNYKY
jgi:hypothetical protein